MKTNNVGLGVIVLLLFPLFTEAQTSLTVPSDTKNTRFYEDVFNIKRPALSIAGFNNNGNNSKGYGLKQILEKLYNSSADQLMVKSYKRNCKISQYRFRRSI
jgi:hypothetical protein